MQVSAAKPSDEAQQDAASVAQADSEVSQITGDNKIIDKAVDFAAMAQNTQVRSSLLRFI